jgi:hypothetical protein
MKHFGIAIIASLVLIATPLGLMPLAAASPCDDLRYGPPFDSETCKRIAAVAGIGEAESARRLRIQWTREQCSAGASTSQGQDECRIKYRNDW